MLPGHNLNDSSNLHNSLSKANYHLSSMGDSSCLIDLSFSDSQHTLQFKESQASIQPWEPVRNKSKPPSRAPQVKASPPTAPRKISSYQRTRATTNTTKIMEQSLLDCNNINNVITTDFSRPTMMQMTDHTIMDTIMDHADPTVQTTLAMEPEIVNQRKRATTEVRQSNERVDAMNKTVGRQPNEPAKVVNIKFRTTRDYLLPLLSQKTKRNSKVQRADKTFDDLRLFDMSYCEPSVDYSEEPTLRDSKDETSFTDLYNMMQDLAAAKIEQESRRDDFVPEMFFRNFETKKEKPRAKPKVVDCWRRPQAEPSLAWTRGGYDPKPISQTGKIRLPFVPEKERILTLSTNTDISREIQSPIRPPRDMIKPVKPKRSSTAEKNDDAYNLDSLMKVRMLGAVFMRKNTASPEPKKIDFNNENRKKKAFENYIRPLKDLAESRRF